MRRWLALVGAVGLLAGTVGGAAAGAAIKTTNVQRDANCGPIATPLGDAYVFAVISSLYGTDAGVDVFDPSTGEPVITRDPDRAVTVSITDTAVSATIPVLPSGTATLTATRTATDSFSFDDNFRDGNQWFRDSGSGTAYALTGTLTLPGVNGLIAVGSEVCSSSDGTFTSFLTNPHSHVTSFNGGGGFCDLTNDSGGELFVFFVVNDQDVFVDAQEVGASGGLGATGEGVLAADGTGTFTIGEYDLDTFEPTGGSATVSMSVRDTGETFGFATTYTNEIYRTRGSLLDLEGTFAGSVGSFDLGPCVLEQHRTKTISTPSNGPKPSGKAPANDTPAGAVTLKAGGKATVATKGASVASEAPYPCLEFLDEEGNPVTIPVEFTVWYKVAGTGSPITIDTAGSDYDTVAAIYTGSPGAFSTVGCVDDQVYEPFGRNTQAWVTVPTVAGTTYWVQIGGLDEVDPRTGVRSLPYGTLKVAVR